MRFTVSLWDVVAALGALVVAAGLWWIYPPAGLIALGLVLIATGVLGTRSELKNRR